MPRRHCRARRIFGKIISFQGARSEDFAKWSRANGSTEPGEYQNLTPEKIITKTNFTPHDNPVDTSCAQIVDDLTHQDGQDGRWYKMAQSRSKTTQAWPNTVQPGTKRTPSRSERNPRESQDTPSCSKMASRSPPDNSRWSQDVF